MKILISGAGIAGLSLAYWLKKYGMEPTIVERASELLVGGYKLDIRGSALEVIRRMDLYDKLRRKNTNMQDALLVDKHGKIIEKMDGEAFGHRSGDDLEVVREGICRTFYEHLTSVDIWFDDVIEAVEQINSGVMVSFKNHDKQQFDLLIGADGLHSKVRQLVFGKEKHNGYTIWESIYAFTMRRIIST
ncbi:FAD-dependent monooxygenase [Legionella israelensis]|uniref:FAD-dependent monooxygenase n=1 Tax=Legionella israelensis TaxID=454 RepID=UPI001FD5CBC1|nr:FAD-dependent monooxygenase [Legionella israelensis]